MTPLCLFFFNVEKTRICLQLTPNSNPTEDIPVVFYVLHTPYCNTTQLLNDGGFVSLFALVSFNITWLQLAVLHENYRHSKYLERRLYRFLGLSTKCRLKTTTSRPSSPLVLSIVHITNVQKSPFLCNAVIRRSGVTPMRLVYT